MGKKDRTGNRKTRDQRKRFKVPELGYYLIVTDTEATERCFFNGLHQALPEDVRNKLVIKVVETKTRTMIDKCLELTVYDAQYRIPWIVFDRDQVQGFDEIIKEAEDKGIQVGWSNPCFEIWLYAYFGSMPAIQDSWICCSDFGRVYENICAGGTVRGNGVLRSILVRLPIAVTIIAKVRLGSGLGLCLTMCPVWLA